MNLIEEFRGLIAALDEDRIPYALCGGLAMAVYAFPRATVDIDLLIPEASLEAAKATARRCGFTLDAGLMRFKAGRSRIYRMTKIVQGDREPLMIDFLLVTTEIQTVWDSIRRVEWDFGEVSVVSPKGLIRLKELRGSAQDLADIERLRSLEDEA